MCARVQIPGHQNYNLDQQTHSNSWSVSFKLFEELMFLCNFNPGGLAGSFVDPFDGLATQSKAKTKLKFLEIRTNVKSKLNQFFSLLNRHHCHEKSVEGVEGVEGIEKEKEKAEEEEEEQEEEQNETTNFFLKNHGTSLLIWGIRWGEISKRSPGFGSNNAEDDISLIKSYLLPPLFNEQRIQP